MKRSVIAAAILFMLICACSGNNQEEAMGDEMETVIFAAFAGGEEQLQHALVLAESLRTFGGKYMDAPVWVYVPEEFLASDSSIIPRFAALNVEIKTSTAPEAALIFPYARKVFAAAEAEIEAENKTAVLVWMDDDTIILQEPNEFMLAEGINFGWRPVMHQLIGSVYSEPPDEFWSLVFKDLDVPEEAMFPMYTHTDNVEIRPYFNAGVMVVRPEKGILRKWAESFPVLYGDSVIVEMCREDRLKAIFLHQVALACGVLNTIGEDDMIRLSDKINYPMFFKEMFGADHEYDDLNDVVTLRYDVYFRNPAPDWSEKLNAPDDIIVWLKERLGAETVSK
jgi:hypothetical protein